MEQKSELNENKYNINYTSKTYVSITISLDHHRLPLPGTNDHNDEIHRRSAPGGPAVTTCTGGCEQILSILNHKLQT
jgi:hypothetical protein